MHGEGSAGPRPCETSAGRGACEQRPYPSTAHPRGRGQSSPAGQVSIAPTGGLARRQPRTARRRRRPAPWPLASSPRPCRRCDLQRPPSRRPARCSLRATPSRQAQHIRRAPPRPGVARVPLSRPDLRPRPERPSAACRHRLRRRANRPARWPEGHSPRAQSPASAATYRRPVTPPSHRHREQRRDPLPAPRRPRHRLLPPAVSRALASHRTPAPRC